MYHIPHLKRAVRMAEETFYKEDFDRGAEYHSDPEYLVRPEFNDLASQKPYPPRREKKRSGFLKGMLGSAVRGGAAVLAAAAVVTSIATGTQQNIGETAAKVKDIVSPATRPAFTQQDGLTPGDFALLWERSKGLPL